MTKTRTVIDVSGLPPSAVDHRSPVWWGNLLLLTIESTMFGILVASYFYLRINFENWPPPQSNYLPPSFTTAPNPAVGSYNLLLILCAVVTMFVADRACLRLNRKWATIGLLATVMIGAGAITLRWHEFQSLKFRWDDNAYASVAWGFLVLHLIHLLVGTIEDALMLAYVICYGLDDKHARDIRVTAVYWYWIAGIWVPLFAILYFGPYWL